MKPASSFQLPSRHAHRCVFVAATILMVFLVMGTVAYPVFSQGWREAGSEPAQPVISTTATAQQPRQAVLHPIGIGIAFLFLILMTTLFRWMFKVPPAVPREVAAIRRSVAAMQRILVPVSGKMASERAVELACRLGEAQKAEIVLAYIIEVPFTLSLGTSVAAEEGTGQEVLRTARFIVEQHGLPVKTKIIPHRYVWSGILDLAREEMVDAIVMNVGTGRPGQEDGMGRTAQEVLRRAECEVILDKGPR